MAVTPLASLDDLKARLEFELDDAKMEGLAQSALEDASTLVREYGVRTWDVNTAPPIAVMLTLKAAARFVNNPMALETARGADETNMWGSANASGVFLSPDEIELLREHRKTNKTLHSAPMQLWGAQPLRSPANLGQAPVDYGGKWFPLYAEGADCYFPYYPDEWG